MEFYGSNFRRFFMIYKTKLPYVLLALACIFQQLAVAQLQLSDPDEQLLLTSTQPTFVLRSVQLSNGIRLQYAEQGASSGIPVILLHGFTDSWRSFEQVLPLLPESIHAYALSQRGHGTSDHSANEYRPEDFAGDVAGFMKHFNIKSAVIVGHSMGATVAQRFALDHPEMTKALVLAGAFASYNNNASVDELKQFISKMDDPIDFGFAYEFQKSTLFNPIAMEYVESYAKESMKVPARIWKAIANQLMNVNYIKELSEVKSPALIIWGDRDNFCSGADQHTLHTALKGSILTVYKDVGHAIHWEDPQRFTKDLIDFIIRIGKK